MAIRYSGDVEIRLTYGGASWVDKAHTRPRFSPRGEGFYYAHLRAPYLRNAAILSFREIGLRDNLTRREATSSNAYDMAAERFLEWAEMHVGALPLEVDDRHRIVVRRVFQSPCPISHDR